MSELVAISKYSGDLMVMVPLFTQDTVYSLNGHQLVTVCFNKPPVAYVVDAGPKVNNGGRCALLAADILENYVEILGEL